VQRLLRSPLLFGLVLLAGAAVALLVADGINNPPSREDLGFVRVDTASRSRVLILLVDSWRHQTAVDSAMMPAVARLSRDGASGKLETVFEGFSIPAIRAEFSGTAETQLVNLIRNFRFRALPTESSFLDANRIGKRTLVVGDEPFTQFGPFLEKRLPQAPGLDIYGLDKLRPGIALDAYRSGSYDLVLCHYETADWRAHEYGVHAPQYAAAFAHVDSVIADFGRARRPGDYLLVFGDHGHNERGEHKTGIYIPTHGLFIGPDIKAGVVFPSLPVSDIRVIVDHALGIQLRAPAREVDRLSSFLPLQPSARAADAAGEAGAHPSRRFSDYLLFALFLAAFGAVTAVAASGGPADSAPARSAWLTVPNIAIATMFVIELLAQQLIHPEWAVFPFLMLGVGAAVWRTDRRRGALVIVIALFFVSRLTAGAGSASPIRTPIGFAELIPLYIAGSCAKLVLLVGNMGWRRRPAVAVAALATAVLAVLEYRVWDFPGTFIAVIAVALVALVRVRGGEAHRLALLVLGYAVLYFTLRLPIYEYAWVDFFVLAVWLASRGGQGALLDALIICGAFTLTSVWLPSGLEWSFLYGIFPAYVIELQVGWFVPFILLKLPMLLLLTLWAADVALTRRFVLLMFLYLGIRFAGVWVVRLAGGTGAQVWPMAEQAIYLTTFAIATVWAYRRARINS
jgi:hypothetical protein